MIDDTRQFFTWWLSAAWQLFGVTVPGFTFSFGTLLLALVLIGAAIDCIYIVWGIGSGGISYRSGSSGNVKRIDERRKYDEY